MKITGKRTINPLLRLIKSDLNNILPNYVNKYNFFNLLTSSIKMGKTKNKSKRVQLTIEDKLKVCKMITKNLPKSV